MFDVLMRAGKAHLEDQFSKDRIKGPEYATVYLGQMEAAMQNGLTFLFQREKIGLETRLLELQITLAGIEVQKANIQLEILEEQKLTAVVERELVQANVAKVEAETLNVPKQGLLIEAQTALAEQQLLNAVVEKEVLEAQVCKLKAEYNYTMQNVEKSAAETELLVQKTATERAQILGLGVDDDSVIGKQKRLYQAQTEGFSRDAEQKVAKILIDTWSTRRMTDDATIADAINKLDDGSIGRAVAKMLSGVNA